MLHLQIIVEELTGVKVLATIPYLENLFNQKLVYIYYNYFFIIPITILYHT